jgi:hypothetical protein
MGPILREQAVWENRGPGKLRKRSGEISGAGGARCLSGAGNLSGKIRRRLCAKIQTGLKWNNESRAECRRDRVVAVKDEFRHSACNLWGNPKTDLEATVCDEMAGAPWPRAKKRGPRLGSWT